MTTRCSPAERIFRLSLLMSSHPALREEGRMTAPYIALLDNDPAALTLLHDLLTGHGYRTLRCRPDDVVSAHALVKRVRPALVILDLWREQREHGWGFLTHLWGDSETAHIPALIVTGAAAVLPMQTAVLRAKRCPVVKKPFDPQDLLSEIAAMLSPSSAERDHSPHLHAVLDADPSVSGRPVPLVAAAGEDV